MEVFINPALDYLKHELKKLEEEKQNEPPQYDKGEHGGYSGKDRIQNLFSDGENQLVKAFLQFLENEKNYPSNSIKLEHRGLNPTSNAVMDMALIVPETGAIVAIIANFSFAMFLMIVYGIQNNYMKSTDFYVQELKIQNHLL